MKVQKHEFRELGQKNSVNGLIYLFNTLTNRLSEKFGRVTIFVFALLSFFTLFEQTYNSFYEAEKVNHNILNTDIYNVIRFITLNFYIYYNSNTILIFSLILFTASIFHF